MPFTSEEYSNGDSDGSNPVLDPDLLVLVPGIDI